MPNINLPTGNTIYVSAYEFYFLLDDDDMHTFYQSCIADDLGVYIENPFSNSVSKGKVEQEESPFKNIDVPDTTTEEDLRDFSL